MTRIMNLINRLHRGESGQDVIEYALISALISVAVIGVILATGFVGTFGAWATAVGNAMNPIGGFPLV